MSPQAALELVGLMDSLGHHGSPGHMGPIGLAAWKSEALVIGIQTLPAPVRVASALGAPIHGWLPRGGLALPGQHDFGLRNTLAWSLVLAWLGSSCPNLPLEFQQNLSTFAQKNFAKSWAHAEIYVYRKLFVLATKASLLFRKSHYCSPEMPCKHVEKRFVLATKATLLFRKSHYCSPEMPCKHVEKRICKTLVKKLKK